MTLGDLDIRRSRVTTMTLDNAGSPETHSPFPMVDDRGDGCDARTRALAQSSSPTAAALSAGADLANSRRPVTRLPRNLQEDLLGVAHSRSQQWPTVARCSGQHGMNMALGCDVRHRRPQRFDTPGGSDCTPAAAHTWSVRRWSQRARAGCRGGAGAGARAEPLRAHLQCVDDDALDTHARHKSVNSVSS